MNAGNTLFQTTVMKTNEWITDLMNTLDLPDEHKALRALRAALHTIRDHVPANEAVALGAQLPALVRGLYYEGWRLTDRPPRLHSHDELMGLLRRELGPDPALDPESVLRAVMRVLHRHVSAGELRHLAMTTSRPLASIWGSELGLPASTRY